MGGVFRVISKVAIDGKNPSAKMQGEQKPGKEV
jgi:hypothetical protein